MKDKLNNYLELEYLKYNDIHENITRFWLAESSAVQL